MDFSILRWIENIEQPWCLIAMIDDGNGKIYAEFHPRDTTKSNMKVIKSKKVSFLPFIQTKHPTLRPSDMEGFHYDVRLEHRETQIQMALKELNIEIIHANSPKAKRRI